MQLHHIDKPTYQERRSRIQWTIIAALFILSLGFAELYRAVLAGGESSLWLNAMGVATGAAIIVFVLLRQRHTPYFKEVTYVWDLKQELNRIYRKSKALDEALEEGHKEALLIKLYSLEGSRQVYDLDDNTLTMSELSKDLDALRERIAEQGYKLSANDYDRSLLAGL